MNNIPIRQIKEPDFAESFNIRSIEALLSEKDLVHELHRHNFFFILVLEKGSGEHLIDFTSYLVRDYVVFFMRPGQVHQLTLEKGSTGYLLEFDANFYAPTSKSANQVFRKVSHKNYCQLNLASFKKIALVLAYIFQEYTEKQEKYKDVIKANLEIFFIELARQNQDNQHLLSSSNYSQERLEELLELIETHIATNKQVAQYADMMNLTSFQLNAITKETLGKTCSQLINEHIILESKRYIIATTSQINQIAYHLGYEDTSYFIRFFKKHTGYSPEAFRQNFK